MTGFCAIQGIPIIEYVNARARTDEWPPKYWKVRTHLWQGKHVVNAGIMACACPDSISDQASSSDGLDPSVPISADHPRIPRRLEAGVLRSQKVWQD